MHAQDLLATADIGTVHRDLTVETARAQQRRVEDVGTVGGGDEDHALVLLEAVHLDEQLIERLLALVVAAAQAGTALTADRVDLVDEDDRRRLLLGVLEEVAHARGAHTHEHLDELGTGDGEERHARLAGDGLGQQGLAGAGGTDQQHAARNLGAELAEPLGIGQKVADLLEFLNRFIDAGDVLELDVGTRGLGRLGVRLAELHRLVIGTGHLAHEVEHDKDEQAGGQNRHQQVHQHVGVLGVHFVRSLGVGGHELCQGIGTHIGGGEALKVAFGLLLALGPIGALDRAIEHRVGRLVDAVGLHGGHELARGQLGGLVAKTRPAAQIPEKGTHEDAGDGKVNVVRAARASRTVGAAGGRTSVHATRRRGALTIRTGAAALGHEGGGAQNALVVAVGHATRRPPA